MPMKRKCIALSIWESGMILVVAPGDANEVAKHFACQDEPCYDLGFVVFGNKTVIYD
jgi:hypothetical protein